MAFPDTAAVDNLSGADDLMNRSFYHNRSIYEEGIDFHGIMNDFKRNLFKMKDPVSIVLVSCYSIVFVLALLGNLLVILVILGNRSMRTSITNSYLLNLAFADLLVTLMCIPLTAGELLYSVWMYGYLLCKITNYVQGLCISASVLTIMTLSLDRYVAIRHPVRSRSISTPSCVRLTIIAIWVVSAVIMVPIIIVMDFQLVGLPQGEPVCLCNEIWPENNRIAFDSFLFVFIYVMPGSIIIFNYASTGCRLLTSDSILQRTDSDVYHSEKMMTGRRRLARMLLMLAILFAVSWMPYHTVNLYMDITSNTSDNLTILSFSLLLGHSHSAQNPLLYCFMNKNFKRGMQNILNCRKKKNIPVSRRSTWRETRRTLLASSQRSRTPDPNAESLKLTVNVRRNRRKGRGFPGDSISDAHHHKPTVKPQLNGLIINRTPEPSSCLTDNPNGSLPPVLAGHQYSISTSNSVSVSQ